MSFYANSEILACDGWFVWYFSAAEICDAMAQFHLGPVQTPLHSCAESNWWFKSTAKEWCLNQFATAVLVRYGKSVWCGKSSTGSVVVELNLCSTHGAPSESDIAPVSLQSRTYSVRFGTRKVRRLNQAWLVPPHQGRTYKHKHNMVLQVTQA